MGLFSKPPKVKRKRIMTRSQMALLKNLAQTLTARDGKGLGLDPLAERGYTMFDDLLGPEGRITTSMGAGLDRLASGQYAIPYNDPDREQFLREAFIDPSTATFREDVLPSIAEMFAARGLEDSGDFQRAALDAGRRLTTDLSGQRAQLINRQQELAPQNMAAAQQLGFAPINASIQAGQYRQFANNPGSDPAYGLVPAVLGAQPYALVNTPGKKGFGSTLTSLIGAGVGAYFGGPAGAQAGAAGGNALGTAIFG